MSCFCCLAVDYSECLTSIALAWRMRSGSRTSATDASKTSDTANAHSGEKPETTTCGDVQISGRHEATTIAWREVRRLGFLTAKRSEPCDEPTTAESTSFVARRVEQWESHQLKRSVM